ncbi:hypothetical protein JM946_00365 [Steroidobacter sp. S1-65]|uniref:Uncharacterized protein n=1 Tax=Steroidobacter gossypii TaxID=2805490 RepID=A0ABS1WQC3_9GAMM|nr:hypothetical protein [Steroidobacter gossypii]MBM0103172.1 hypothetical protein [Steroidobacter gossypii]
MRLIRLALVLAAVSFNGAAVANPAVNSNVSGSIAGTVGANMAGSVGSNASTQMVAGQAQVRLGGLNGNDRNLSRSSSAGAMDESMPRGWLMALVTVLLIGHQLRRKHRFLRPQRFSDL